MPLTDRGNEQSQLQGLEVVAMTAQASPQLPPGGRPLEDDQASEVIRRLCRTLQEAEAGRTLPATMDTVRTLRIELSSVPAAVHRDNVIRDEWRSCQQQLVAQAQMRWNQAVAELRASLDSDRRVCEERVRTVESELDRAWQRLRSVAHSFAEQRCAEELNSIMTMHDAARVRAQEESQQFSRHLNELGQCRNELLATKREKEQLRQQCQKEVAELRLAMARQTSAEAELQGLARFECQGYRQARRVSDLRLTPAASVGHVGAVGVCRSDQQPRQHSGQGDKADGRKAAAARASRKAEA